MDAIERVCNAVFPSPLPALHSNQEKSGTWAYDVEVTRNSTHKSMNSKEIASKTR